MTFEQDLNVWCCRVDTQIGKVKEDIAALKNGQKLLIGMCTANIALIIALIGVLVR
jgi:hypothetical protein